MKYPAFMPNRADNKLSMFKIMEELSEEEIWDLNERWGRRDRKIHGRAQVLKNEILVFSLQIEEDGEWDGLHLNIAGWPKDKLDQRDFAQQIAEQAILFLKNQTV